MLVGEHPGWSILVASAQWEWHGMSLQVGRVKKVLRGTCKYVVNCRCLKPRAINRGSGIEFDFFAKNVPFHITKLVAEFLMHTVWVSNPFLKLQVFSVLYFG